MAAHIERKIRFCEHIEHNPANTWCLQELDEDGNQVGDDLIPFTGSNYFTVNELTYKALISGISGISDGDECSFYDEDDPSGPMSVELEEVILGSLRSSTSNFVDGEDGPNYSMFGTSRIVNYFSLKIRKTGNNGSGESCTFFGTPTDAYKNDTLDVVISLSTDKFDRIANMVKTHEVDAMHLRVGDMLGLYVTIGPWALYPQIKVLPYGQSIDRPEDCDFNPGRLNKVHEFSLNTARRCLLSSREVAQGHNGGSLTHALEEYLEDYPAVLPYKGDELRDFHSQFNEILKQVGTNIVFYSNSRGENVHQFKAKVDDAFNILGSIRFATNDELRERNLLKDLEDLGPGAERDWGEHTIWRHGDLALAIKQGFGSKHQRKIEADELQREVIKYLSRPWMENSQLERIIVDALAYCEISGFAEHVKMGAFPFDGTYFQAGGNVERMFWLRLQRRLVKATLLLGIPIGLGWYFWNHGYGSEVMVAAAGGAGLIMLYLGYRLVRWILGTKPQTGAEKNQELLMHMCGVYDMLGKEVVSPTALREQLMETTRRGALWPGAMFSILDYAIRRNPVVWGNTEQDEYRE